MECRCFTCNCKSIGAYCNLCVLLVRRVLRYVCLKRDAACFSAALSRFPPDRGASPVIRQCCMSAQPILPQEIVMDGQFALQVLIVLACLFFGARKGGVALGLLGAWGL